MLKSLITKKSGLIALSLLSLSIAGCNSGGAGTATGATGSTGSSGASLDTGAALASVGGENISRGEVFSFLEANAGKQALAQLIDYRLVLQEAKAKKVELSDAEVDAEIARRQETTPALAEVVKTGGGALNSYKQQLRSQMLMDRLLTQDIKADEAAVNKWLASPDPSDPSKKAKTRARYDKPAQVKIGILLTSQKARADVMASQLKGGKSFSDLVKEQKAAKDQIATQSTANTSEAGPEGSPPPPNGGYLPATQLPPPVQSALAKLEVNGTTPPLVLQKSAGKTPGVFGIVQLLDRKPESKASATDPNVVMDYKLTQVALKSIKQGQPNATLETVIPQIMQQAMQAAMQSGRFEQPTYRQAIDQINQAEVQALMSRLRTSATANVQVSDEQYKSLRDTYKPIPAAASIGTPGAGGAPAANGAPAVGGAAAGGAADAGTASAASDAPAANSAPAAGAPAAGAPTAAPR